MNEKHFLKYSDDFLIFCVVVAILLSSDFTPNRGYATSGGGLIGAATGYGAGWVLAKSQGWSVRAGVFAGFVGMAIGMVIVGAIGYGFYHFGASFDVFDM